MKTVKDLTDAQKKAVLAAYRYGMVGCDKHYGHKKIIIKHLVKDGILSDTYRVPPRYVLTPFGFALAECLEALQSITMDQQP